jgi:hypothetical protein
MAAMVLHLIAEVRRLKVAAALKENEPPISY